MASSIFVSQIGSSQTVIAPFAIGTSTTPITAAPGLTVYANVPLELYSNFANGVNLYTASTTGFRAPAVAFYKNHGTFASPSDPLSGDALGTLSWGGYSSNSSAYVANGALFTVIATENWDSTHRGTQWQLRATPNTSVTDGSVITVRTRSDTNAIGIGLGSNVTPNAQLSLASGQGMSWASAGFFNHLSDGLWSFTNNAVSAYGSLQIGSDVFIGFLSGSRSTRSTLQSATGAVTLSGASTATTNIIPAGATVESVSTTTTTAITGASGYTVGDGSDADRYGDITGTALGTNSGSANYTADPRWWTNAARAITLTAKTSNFTGGVVQVTVFYWTAVGA